MGVELLNIAAELRTFSEPMHPDEMARIIGIWVSALADTNVVYLRLNPNTPSLYQSGVYYAEEKKGYEEFFDIPTVLLQGYADCEDLAAWRAAEYIVNGYWANILVSWEALELSDGTLDILFHVRVVTQFGVEDPSAILGMDAGIAWGVAS